MKYHGNLLKMRSENQEKVHYFLELGPEEIAMNDLIGENIELKYLHQINCIRCGRKTSKSFAQGYCFPCFQSAPETEECVLRPELCRAQEGIARDMEYAKEHCLIDQFVYLSFTSGLKVGVTRSTQIPTRWIDQGATAAIRIARTPNRYTAGLIEVALKNYYADKTNWRNMLKDTEVTVDLEAERTNAQNYLSSELAQYALEGDSITFLEYPVQEIPEKINSLNLDKNDIITGKLVGIKGQYLIFETGGVLNVRSYGGYLVDLTVV